MSAARYGAQRCCHRYRQGADRVCARGGHRADGPRAGVRVSPDRPGARRGSARHHGAILTIALIESARGVENADAILTTPGLDLGWLGHYDLSDSLGCAEDFSDPRYLAAEQRLLAAAAATGKPLGWLVPTGEAAQLALRRGFRCICIGHEVAMLRNALAQEFVIARKGGPATPR